MEALQNVLLVLVGYLAAEVSAYFKWRRGRQDRKDDQEQERLAQEKADAQAALERRLQLHTDFQAAAHHVAVGGGLAGWQDQLQALMGRVALVKRVESVLRLGFE